MPEKDSLRKYFIKYFYSKFIAPKSINLEITNACNLSCVFCHRLRKTKRRDLNFNLFKEIVNQAKAFGPIFFALHKFGEPLMNKNILDYVSYIKSVDKDNNIYLTTNGLLLNRHLAKELLRLKVDHINFSIGANASKTYLRLRKGGDLDRVEENLKELISLKKRSHSKIYITAQIIKMDETETEIEEFIKKWRGCGVVPTVWDKISMDAKSEMSRTNHLKKKYPCVLLWTDMVVNSDGRVSICVCDCKSEVIFGDTNKEAILSIWNGKEIKKYRRMHLGGNYNQITLCKNCDYILENEDLFSLRNIRDILVKTKLK